MFIGAAGGIAMSHLPGLPVIAGVAMGIGAMSVVMLTLPLTSVLLPTVLLLSDGLAVMPLVIVAVVVAHVAAARIAPAPYPRAGMQRGHGPAPPATGPLSRVTAATPARPSGRNWPQEGTGTVDTGA
jgi:hypothetical protein